MTAAVPLSHIVRVNARFTRSVSLVRDFERADASQGYIQTPAGRDVLVRLAEAMRGVSATRAWSLRNKTGTPGGVTFRIELGVRVATLFSVGRGEGETQCGTFSF